MQKPPQTFYIPLERRRFLKSLALISAGFTVPGYLAEALTLTPSVTQGPFYPLATNMPLDDDNDLAFFNPNVTAADGIISYVFGRVLDSSGNPIKNALVEIWHTDNDGNYIYSNSQPRNPAADPKFRDSASPHRGQRRLPLPNDQGRPSQRPDPSLPPGHYCPGTTPPLHDAALLE
jgi:protocatechuate 3,4-dioxygenase, beta subunit